MKQLHLPAKVCIAMLRGGKTIPDLKRTIFEMYVFKILFTFSFTVIFQEHTIIV